MYKTFLGKAEGVAHDGSARVRTEAGEARIFGMLLGEEGIIEVHKKHGLLVGTLKELTVPSPARKMPDELHYLACSPFQVMEYPLQAEIKRNILSELFSYYPDAPKVEFTPASQFYGYRTKIEFSFCDREGEDSIPLSLAFHERGGGSRRIPLLAGCALASDDMNRIALAITKKLREAGCTARDLKSLVVRESKSTGKILAILYAKAGALPEFSTADIDRLAGFIVFHSTEKSPASVPTKELWCVGESELCENILGCDVTYSWDSFFQNNIRVFARAVEEMQKVIPVGANILELYSGVGTIGLLLAQSGAKHVHGVEIVPGAVNSAKKNAENAKLTNYVAECIPAEKMDARLLEKRDVLVLDPPRAGLHPKVIAMIKENPPRTIVYLSCNPETQARDYSALKELYKIERMSGFDFYPQTPHLESLLILSLRTE